MRACSAADCSKESSILGCGMFLLAVWIVSRPGGVTLSHALISCLYACLLTWRFQAGERVSAHGGLGSVCLITWKLAATSLGICLVAAWLHHRRAIFSPHGTRSAGKRRFTLDIRGLDGGYGLAGLMRVCHALSDGYLARQFRDREVSRKRSAATSATVPCFSHRWASSYVTTGKHIGVSCHTIHALKTSQATARASLALPMFTSKPPRACLTPSFSELRTSNASSIMHHAIEICTKELVSAALLVYLMLSYPL